jgi:uncharacterized membrane protein
MPPVVVLASADGFVTEYDLDAIAHALEGVKGSVEISCLRSIGSYVAFQDPIAEIRGDHIGNVESLVNCVVGCARLEQDRDVDQDPVYGIEQMTTIAWRSISTS